MHRRQEPKGQVLQTSTAAWVDRGPSSGLSPRVQLMAEAVRFELTDGFPRRRFSRPVP
jgi:hypothetical protein